MLSLAAKRVLITGGSRGIGRATALLFARLGARVALSYATDAAAADEVVREIGVDSIALQADLARVEHADRLVAFASRAMGGIDILVVNHGIWKQASLPDLT